MRAPLNDEDYHLYGTNTLLGTFRSSIGSREESREINSTLRLKDTRLDLYRRMENHEHDPALADIHLIPTISRMETYKQNYKNKDTYQRSQLSVNSADTIQRYGRTDSYGKAVKQSTITKLRPTVPITREPKVKVGRAIIGLYNLVFWISGAAIFSLGVSKLLDNHTLELSNILKVELISYHPSSSVLYWLSLGLLLSGGIVFITGFFGCWSSLYENPTATVLYLSLILVSCMGELSITIIAIITRGLILEGVEKDLLALLKVDYNMVGHAAFSRSIDLMQAKFECCGVTGVQDYANSAWRQEQDGSRGDKLLIPLTCCSLANSDELTSYLDPRPNNLTSCQDLNDASGQGRYRDGCTDRLVNWGAQQSLNLAGVALGGVILHVLGVVLTCSLLQRIKKK